MINIDESIKATKKHIGSLHPLLYLHFNNKNTNHITARITTRTMDNKDPEMKQQNQEIFPPGSVYVRVRVSGDSIKALNIFKDIFSKLLNIYAPRF